MSDKALPPDQVKALQMIRDGGSIKSTAEACGVSRSTISRWKQQWETAGIDWETEQAESVAAEHETARTRARTNLLRIHAAEAHNTSVTAAELRAQIRKAVQLLNPADMAKDPRAMKDIAIAFAILSDKALKLSAGVIAEEPPAAGPAPGVDGTAAGAAVQLSDAELWANAQAAAAAAGVVDLTARRKAQNG